MQVRYTFSVKLMDFTNIFQFKGLKPKNKGHANFYESSDLTKKVYLAKIAQVCILKSCLKHLGYCFFRIDMCRKIHLNRKISHTKRSPNDAISTDFYHTLIFLIGNILKRNRKQYIQVARMPLILYLANITGTGKYAIKRIWEVFF